MQITVAFRGRLTNVEEICSLYAGCDEFRDEASLLLGLYQQVSIARDSQQRLVNPSQSRVELSLVSILLCGLEIVPHDLLLLSVHYLPPSAAAHLMRTMHGACEKCIYVNCESFAACTNMVTIIFICNLCETTLRHSHIVADQQKGRKDMSHAA